MVLKRSRDYPKATQDTSVTSFKKKRSETSSLPIDQCKIDNNKLTTSDTINKEVDSWICFWNKSANKINTNLEKEGNDKDDKIWKRNILK